MTKPFTTLSKGVLTLGAIPVLAACNASVAGYESLESTAAKTSELGGVALLVNVDQSTWEVVETIGSLTHNTGAITIDDGTYVMTDPDGYDNLGQLTDGNSTVVADDGTLIPGVYEYVALYEQDYLSGGDYHIAIGVGGIVTDGSDVPVAGTAIYFGDAYAELLSGGDTYILDDGTSVVLADFGAATVDALMSGFTTLDSFGDPIVGPVDSIELNGMTIDEIGFYGGTHVFLDGTDVVDVFGNNGYAEAMGNFYGWDDVNSIPDEVGGIFFGSGDDGSAIAIFIAD